MKSALVVSVAIWSILATSAVGQVVAPSERARERVVTGMHATDRDAAVAAFDEAIVLAREAVAATPAIAEAHYLLAVALGGRLEYHGLRTKARMAVEVKREAEAALILDPRHAGAHHVLGRIHAGAMRLNPIARAIARAVLGASTLKDASWEAAEAHFLVARDLEPQNPMHAMELGALYVDTGRAELARQTWAAVVEQASKDGSTDPALERVRELLAGAEPTGGS